MSKNKYLSDKQRLQQLEKEITELEIQILNHRDNIFTLNSLLSELKKTLFNKMKIKIQKFLYKVLGMEKYVELLSKEKRLANIETALEAMSQKLLEKNKIKDFLKSKIKEEEYILYDKIIYSPEIREEIEKQQKANQENSKSPTIKVTEHGLLRYLERVKRLDINAIKNEMVPQELEEAAKKDGTYEIKGLRYIIQEGQIVTVIGFESNGKNYEVDNIKYKNVIL